MVMKVTLQPEPEVRTIAAGEFKAKCLQLMDEVKQGKLTLIVTKRGQPVSHIIPPTTAAKPFRSIFGRSPSMDVPDHTHWKKLKAEWAAEWDASTEKLVHAVTRPKSVKK
jgi:prevent-host-death family protein